MDMSVKCYWKCKCPIVYTHIFSCSSLIWHQQFFWMRSSWDTQWNVRTNYSEKKIVKVKEFLRKQRKWQRSTMKVKNLHVTRLLRNCISLHELYPKIFTTLYIQDKSKPKMAKTIILVRSHKTSLRETTVKPKNRFCVTW